jgi:chromosome partitioning protein
MIITIGHSKGGVGKSTIAYNLAYSLLQTDEKVTIIDLDFQQTLFFIHSLAEFPACDVLQPKSASELIEIFEDHHGYLIVDVGGFDSDINRIALNYADKVIVPISNSVTDVIGFKTFEAILDEIDPKGSINLLLNNIHPLCTHFDDVKEATQTTLEHTKLLDTVIRNRKIYKDSLVTGQSVFDFKDKKAISEIIGLRDEIVS